MTIGALNRKGEFAGSYHTAVTATTNAIQESPLQGAQDRTNQKNQPTFGFTVNWKFSGASPLPSSLWSHQWSTDLPVKPFTTPYLPLWHPWCYPILHPGAPWPVPPPSPRVQTMCWALGSEAPHEAPSPLTPPTCFPHHCCPQRAGTAWVYCPLRWGRLQGHSSALL